MPKYDTVILGAGVGGCAVAAMLAKAGKRVMIMDPAAAPGGGSASVELQGYRISGWPTCVYGFEEGGSWNAVLHDLGLDHAPPVQGASYQVAMPGRRVTVSPDTAATLEELSREFPREIDAVRRFYSDIGGLGKRMSRSRMFAYIGRRRRTGDLLRSYRFSKELLAFFSASSFAFFGLAVQDLSVAQLVVLVTTPPQVISGGFDKITAKLCELVTQQGGECRLGEPWPELLVRRSRLEGIQTVRERLDLRTAVLNVPWRVRERTLFSIVREDVIPMGMLDTVIVVQDYERPEASMVLSLDSQLPRGTSDRSVRPLRAFFPAAMAGQDATPEDLIGNVSQIMPFLADFTEAVSLRDSRDRALLVPHYEEPKQPQKPSGGALPLRLPVRTIYILDDAPFGAARQGSAARALASRLS